MEQSIEIKKKEKKRRDSGVPYGDPSKIELYSVPARTAASTRIQTAGCYKGQPCKDSRLGFTRVFSLFRRYLSTRIRRFLSPPTSPSQSLIHNRLFQLELKLSKAQNAPARDRQLGHFHTNVKTNVHNPVR